MKRYIKVFLFLLSLVLFINVVSQAADIYITKNGHLAAVNKEKLETAIQYEKNGNKKGLDNLIEEGTVIRLKGGVPVAVLNGDFYKYMKQIKFLDEKVKTYWVMDEAIEPNK